MASLSQPRRKERAPRNAARRPWRDRHDGAAADVGASSPRPAVPGDICVLLAISDRPTPGGAAFIDRLQADLGGEVVEPLHVTIDRVATEDVPGLIRTVRESLRRVHPARIVVDRLYFLPSQSRGPEIVKLEVASDPILDQDIEVLLAALRLCGLPSLYPSDRAKPTITTLERVVRRDSVTPDLTDLPLELFVADRVIVSRIAGLARYEILDTASIATSG